MVYGLTETVGPRLGRSGIFASTGSAPRRKRLDTLPSVFAVETSVVTDPDPGVTHCAVAMC